MINQAWDLFTCHLKRSEGASRHRPKFRMCITALTGMDTPSFLPYQDKTTLVRLSFCCRIHGEPEFCCWPGASRICPHSLLYVGSFGTRGSLVFIWPHGWLDTSATSESKEKYPLYLAKCCHLVNGTMSDIVKLSNPWFGAQVISCRWLFERSW